MRIRPLVQKIFETAEAYTPVTAVREQLARYSYVVVYDDSNYVGVLNYSDIAQTPRNLVIDCLHQKPTVDIEDHIENVLVKMRETGHSVLPVLDGGHFHGVILQMDIVDYILQYRSELEREVGACTNELSCVNERLLLEIRRQQEAQEALKESEARFRELADLLPQPIFETSADGMLTFINRAAFDLFGYDSRDMAEGIHFTNCFAPSDRERSITNARKRLAGETAGSGEYTAQRKDGGQFTVIVRSNPIIRNGVPIGLRGAIIDISDLKTAQTDRLQERLREERLKMLGSLASGIAHDLNNILSGIFGHVELAKLELGSHEPGKEHLEQILDNSTRARDLVAQLLTFARGDKPRLSGLHIEPLARRLAQEIFSSTQISVYWIIEPLLPAILADKMGLDQLLTNIFINARDAMDQTGTLTFRAEKQRKYCFGGDENDKEFVKLEIADTGCGVADDVLKSIFDPFFTTKTTGTGLGLAICRNIVRNWGGEICARQNEIAGHGAIFTIIVPADRDSDK